MTFIIFGLSICYLLNPIWNGITETIFHVDNCVLDTFSFGSPFLHFLWGFFCTIVFFSLWKIANAPLRCAVCAIRFYVFCLLVAVIRVKNFSTSIIKGYKKRNKKTPAEIWSSGIFKFPAILTPFSSFKIRKWNWMPFFFESLVLRI